MHFAVAGGAVAWPGVVARTVIMCICVVQRPRVHVAAGDSKVLLEIVEPRLHVLYIYYTHNTHITVRKRIHRLYRLYHIIHIIICICIYIVYIYTY